MELRDFANPRITQLIYLRFLSTVEQFTATLDKVVDDVLTADYWQITLPNALATSAPRSPSLYAYYAALNLLEARVMLSSMRVHELFDPALKTKRSAIERHHLFPRGHLKTLGIESLKDVNQIANYALVEWPKNNAISAQDPAAYWPAYSRDLSPGALERMRFWHALPDGWHEMTYGEFLVARRRMLAQVIKAGFERGRLPPRAGEAHPHGVRAMHRLHLRGLKRRPQ